MTNRFYIGGSVPPSHGSGSSAQLRTEFDAVEAGFNAVEGEIDTMVVDAVGLVGFKNAIINGRMQVAQRATSVANISSANQGYKVCDRWGIGISADTLVVTQSLVSSHPIIGTSGWAFQTQVTTAEAAISAGNNAEIYQHIESDHIYHLVGQTCTLQFWVKSPKTGIHCVALRNGAFNRSLVKEYTVSQADTWEKKTITFTLQSAGNMFVAGHLVGITVLFTLFAGTTYQAAPDVWQNGNYIASANQQNLCDTIGNVFAITDVQFEYGSVATNIEMRHPAIEQTLCERYYQKGYAFNVAPGTAYTAGQGWIGAGGSGTNCVANVGFSTKMRAAPTVTVWDHGGNINKVSYYNGTWNGNLSPGFISAHEGGFSLGAAFTNTTLIDFKWSADAEL